MLHSCGPSLENVTRLKLGHVVVHPSTLAMFVSHFPHLDDLSISTVRLPTMLDGTGDLRYEFHADIAPTHPRGKFSVSDIPTHQAPGGVFEAITLLEPRFHQVSLAHVNYDTWRNYWPLIEVCAGSLEELYIFAAGTGE